MMTDADRIRELVDTLLQAAALNCKQDAIKPDLQQKHDLEKAKARMITLLTELLVPFTLKE